MTDGKSETQQRFEQDDANEVYDASRHWPVLKRPSVAGSNAPRDRREQAITSAFAISRNVGSAHTSLTDRSALDLKHVERGALRETTVIL
jgi:hypothetical protein